MHGNIMQIVSMTYTLWIKSEEIGSLRLTVAVPRILFDADLTASTTELQVGEGTPAISWAHLLP